MPMKSIDALTSANPFWSEKSYNVVAQLPWPKHWFKALNSKAAIAFTCEKLRFNSVIEIKHIKCCEPLRKSHFTINDVGKFIPKFLSVGSSFSRRKKNSRNVYWLAYHFFFSSDSTLFL